MRIPRYVILHKERGQTPLQALTAWKEAHPEHSSLPASYAGRLDPMAEGMLLVLLGDECKRQERYTMLDKEYEIEVLLGAGSDTGDVLGLIDRAPQEPTFDSRELHAALRNEQGTCVVPYPAFSSKTAAGKPLFLYALEGTLDTISIPEHAETFYRISLLAQEPLSTDALRVRIETALAVVPHSDEPSKALGADFRIAAVRASWEQLFATYPDRTYAVLTLRVSCASGAYMRSLAGRLGAALGTHGLALSIRRTRIGRFVQVGRYGWWWNLLEG